MFYNIVRYIYVAFDIQMQTCLIPCINYLKNNKAMFCCTPQHMELSIAKTEPDYEQFEPNPTKFNQIIKSEGAKHKLTKNSSLQVDSKFNYELKIGHDRHSQLLFQLCDASKQIYLTNISKKFNDEKLWRVLGQKDTHELRTGDKVRIGFSELLVYGYSLFYQQEKESVQFKSQYNCRYCFANTYTAKDPLLNMCKCSGSVKYLHLECLRNWLMMKLEEEDRGEMVLYTVNKLECELCKTEWPKEVLVNGEFEGLLSFQTNFSDSLIVSSAPYIVFQTDTLDEDDFQQKVFIKIYLDGKFYFGDSVDTSDLPIEIYGVSPLHCFIHAQNNKIYITDCGSAAGTLVTMHEQQVFTNKRSLFLQYGLLLLNIGFEQPMFWCFTPEQEYKLKYKIQYESKK